MPLRAKKSDKNHYRDLYKRSKELIPKIKHENYHFKRSNREKSIIANAKSKKINNLIAKEPFNILGALTLFCC